MRNKNTLDITHPEIAAQWHTILNDDKKPSDYTHGSDKKVWWKCVKCQSDYDAAISNRTCNNSGCPYCAGMKVNNTNCLAIKQPELAKEWHPNKNENITPYDVVSGSGIECWWLCPKCKAEYKASPNKRSYLIGCKSCEMKEKSLSTKYPEIAKEWHPTKNGDAKPYNVFSGSGVEYWWLCAKCSSGFSTTPNARTSSNDAGCPYCANKRVNNTNCLQTKYPELAQEWNKIKNGSITPYDVVGASNRKHWWKCPDCSLDYEASVNARSDTGHNTGCPDCCVGKNEKLTGQYLKEIFPTLQINHNFLIPEQILKSISKTGTVKIDYQFILNNQEYYIEYNGVQHYEPTTFGGRTKEAATIKFIEYQQPRDKWIAEYCQSHNIILISIDGRKYTGESIMEFLKEILFIGEE